MKTTRRWLQSVITAASAEDAPQLPWAAPARSISSKLAAAE
ncbi:MAG: hypothetical protein U5N55_02085 [Cypionkella sp.]|nr:hypothetical protein [Cypionkella sp.]